MSILPWTYTKLRAFENCPRQGYARYVSREYPFVETDAMKEGNRVHKLFERRINDDTPFVDSDTRLEQYVVVPDADTMLLKAEAELGIDRDGQPCSFYDSDCYFRGKLDVLHLDGDTCFIIDWKTGKTYEDPDELQLHAMLAKAHYPDIKHWRGFYVWLRDSRVGEAHTLSPTRTFHKLSDRIAKIKVEDLARKNGLCGWCDLLSCGHNPRGGQTCKS